MVHFNVVLAKAMSEEFNGAQYILDEAAENFISTILIGIQAGTRATFVH